MTGTGADGTDEAERGAQRGDGGGTGGGAAGCGNVDDTKGDVTARLPADRGHDATEVLPADQRCAGGVAAAPARQQLPPRGVRAGLASPPQTHRARHPLPGSYRHTSCIIDKKILGKSATSSTKTPSTFEFNHMTLIFNGVIQLFFCSRLVVFFKGSSSNSIDLLRNSPEQFPNSHVRLGYSQTYFFIGLVYVRCRFAVDARVAPKGFGAAEEARPRHRVRWFTPVQSPAHCSVPAASR